MADALQVLLVDDDVDMLKTLSDILTLRGYDTRTAPTGHAGLAAAETLPGPPAIALVDLRLPDMDGIEMIGRLHEMSELTEVVILTGNASLESAVQALREQSFDYLLKPVQPSQLLDTLDRAGERWRRRLAETALAQSEERLRRMFEAIGDSVFITDREGRVVDANRAATLLSGFELEELRARVLGDLLRGRADASRDRPSSTPEPSGLELGEYTLSTRDGGARVVEMRTAAFTPELFVHTARDLTERRRLEDQLGRAQRMEAVGQLAGGLAHDFNNMLTVVSGYTELLAGDLAEDPGAMEGLREIRQATDRAAKLTRELLMFGRRQVFVPKVVDLNGVVEDLGQMLRRLVRESVEMEIVLGEGVDAVRADRGQLEQVLVNLVVNAGDAMPKGGRLTIETRAEEIDQGRAAAVHLEMTPGPYIGLTVRDTGTGMDPETLSRIFEPFFTTKEPGKGTGLGLSSVYGIVRRSDGFVEVESMPGEGTRFTLFFPPSAEDPDEEHAAPAHARGALPKGAETILVAEDDPTVRAFVRKALELHGYQVLDAGRADAALDLVRGHEGPIHLLLTDLVMPGLAGHELAAEISRLRSETRVILTTGYSREAADPDGWTHASGFLEKPFSTEDLLRAIRDVLDQPPA